jgi:hypothetical protein
VLDVRQLEHGAAVALEDEKVPISGELPPVLNEMFVGDRDGGNGITRGGSRRPGVALAAVAVERDGNERRPGIHDAIWNP